MDEPATSLVVEGPLGSRTGRGIAEVEGLLVKGTAPRPWVRPGVPRRVFVGLADIAAVVCRLLVGDGDGGVRGRVGRSDSQDDWRCG